MRLPKIAEINGRLQFRVSKETALIQEIFSDQSQMEEVHFGEYYRTQVL
jgi:hypothetical protein